MTLQDDTVEIVRDDLYARMLYAVEKWVEAHHPDAAYATVIVDLGSEVPAVQIPVIPGSSAS